MTTAEKILAASLATIPYICPLCERVIDNRKPRDTGVICHACGVWAVPRPDRKDQS